MYYICNNECVRKSTDDLYIIYKMSLYIFIGIVYMLLAFYYVPLTENNEFIYSEDTLCRDITQD